MAVDTKYGHIKLEHNGSVSEFEPVFILRAQDKFSLKLLKVYRYFCELGGSPDAHLSAIDHAAEAFKGWQAWYDTKTPDTKEED